MQLRSETRKLLSELNETDRQRAKAVLSALSSARGSLCHAHCGNGLLGECIDIEYPNRFTMLGVEPEKIQAEASRRRVYARIRRENFGVMWQKYRDYSVYILTLGAMDKKTGANFMKFHSRNGAPLVIGLAGPGLHSWTDADAESIGLKKIADGTYSSIV